MGFTIYRAGEAMHDAAAMQRVWLAEARAAMTPGEPEPCGASDAYVTYAMERIRKRRLASADLARRLAENPIQVQVYP